MASRYRISIGIPYRRRLDNLSLCLEAIDRQTFPHDAFEVLIGSMEDDTDLKSLCTAWKNRLNIVTVASERPFEIPHARNLTLRAALGEICLQMDADSLLHETALTRLYEENYAEGQNACVLGQVLGYGNNDDGDVDHVQHAKFVDHRARLEALIETRVDLRFADAVAIPWAFVWTGFAALPMRAVREHDLFFDEDFRGWGVDDLEWGKRIAAAGLPIWPRENLFALHLPHARSVAENKQAETVNFKRLLRKHTGRDVELVVAFNDIRANQLFPAYQRELATVEAAVGCTLCIAEGVVRGETQLIVAAPSDLQQMQRMFPDFRCKRTLPYVGLATPFDDGAFGRIMISPITANFSSTFREAIVREAGRLSAWPGSNTHRDLFT